MITYFIKEQDYEAGPFTIDQLKLKQLTKETLVWYAAINRWTAAGNVFELRELFRPHEFVSFPFGKNKSQKMLRNNLKQQFKKISLLLFLIQVRK